MDCSDTDVRKPNNQGTVHSPIEVIKPAVAMRVEQAGLGPLISDPKDSIGFVSIAGRASKAEVVEGGLAAKRERLNMFNFKGNHRQRFARLAIGTSLKEVCTNTSPKLGSNVDAQGNP